MVTKLISERIPLIIIPSSLIDNLEIANNLLWTTKDASILLDTSLPVAMIKMHHSTDVSEVILCISNLKERKALHKALEIIEGMLDYKVVCSMELLYT